MQVLSELAFHILLALADGPSHGYAIGKDVEDRSGGRLDPATGEVEEVPLGEGSAPHGVIVGPDGAAWVTDGGQNAIVRVDPQSLKVDLFPLPQDAPPANLNTAAFDGAGVLWFTGQNGIYGRLDPKHGRVEVFDAPRGRGPYGIDATPAGEVWYASLAGSHIARIDPEEVADAYPDIPILGFTNHTDTAGLRAAQAAGLDRVVVRSALAERAPELVQELVT